MSTRKSSDFELENVSVRYRCSIVVAHAHRLTTPAVSTSLPNMPTPASTGGNVSLVGYATLCYRNERKPVSVKNFDANREKGDYNKRRLARPVLLQLFAALPGTTPIDLSVTQRNITKSPNTRAEDGKIMVNPIEISSTPWTRERIPRN